LKTEHRKESNEKSLKKESSKAEKKLRIPRAD